VWRLSPDDSCRHGNGSSQLYFRRAVVLPVACLRAGADGAAWCAGCAARRYGADTARRGATWRRWGCAVAASSAGQAPGGASPGPRQARRASSIAEAGNGWNTRLRQERSAVARQAFGGDSCRLWRGDTNHRCGQVGRDPVNQFCAAVQRVAVIAPLTGHKAGRGIWDIPERTRPLTCNVPVGGSAYGQPSACWRAELPRGVSALSAARWDGSPLCESGRAATAS